VPPTPPPIAPPVVERREPFFAEGCPEFVRVEVRRIRVFAIGFANVVVSDE